MDLAKPKQSKSRLREVRFVDVEKPPLVEGFGRAYAGTIPETMFCEGYRECLQCMYNGIRPGPPEIEDRHSGTPRAMPVQRWSSKGMVCLQFNAQPMRCPGSCERIICQACAGSWFVAHKRTTCPTCRDQALVGTLRTGWGVAFGELLDLVILRCPFSPAGCKFKGKLEELLIHVDPSQGDVGCGYKVVTCGLESCTAQVYQEDLSLHREQCPHRTAYCKDCQLMMPYHALRDHSNNDCPRKVVGCPLGCGQRGLTREELVAHRQLCRQVKVKCPLCPLEVPRGEVDTHLSSDAAHIPPLFAMVEQLHKTVQEQAKSLERMEKVVIASAKAKSERRAKHAAKAAKKESDGSTLCTPPGFFPLEGKADEDVELLPKPTPQQQRQRRRPVHHERHFIAQFATQPPPQPPPAVGAPSAATAYTPADG